MKAPKIKTAAVAAITGFALVFIYLLSLPVTQEESGSRGGRPLTKALETQERLRTPGETEPPLPVDYGFAGLAPAEMARCLSANQVVDHGTGLLTGAHPKFGISATGARIINRSLAEAIKVLAASEQKSMEEGKSSETVTRYLLPANTPLVEAELRKVDKVLRNTLSGDVAAGLSLALRSTLSFTPCAEPHALSVSRSVAGPVLSNGPGIERFAATGNGSGDVFFFQPTIVAGRNGGDQQAPGDGEPAGITYFIRLNGPSPAVGGMAGLRLRWGHLMPPEAAAAPGNEASANVRADPAEADDPPGFSVLNR